MDKKPRNKTVHYLRMDYDGNWGYDKDILETYSTREAMVNDVKKNYLPLYCKHNLPDLKVFRLLKKHRTKSTTNTKRNGKEKSATQTSSQV